MTPPVMVPTANVVSITNELISNVALEPEPEPEPEPESESELSEELELLDESSSFEQEMMVRLKRNTRIM